MWKRLFYDFFKPKDKRLPGIFPCFLWGHHGLCAVCYPTVIYYLSKAWLYLGAYINSLLNFHSSESYTQKIWTIYCGFFSKLRFLVMMKVPFVFHCSISKRYFLRNWAWSVHPTFFPSGFPYSSCIAPFLAMWMHSYDWLETGLFPEDTKIESIYLLFLWESFVGCVFFSGEKLKLLADKTNPLAAGVLRELLLRTEPCSVNTCWWRVVSLLEL